MQIEEEVKFLSLSAIKVKKQQVKVVKKQQVKVAVF
jgi:hypothetical protein